MSRAFKRLERVLELEAKQGYQNKAVVGGIRQFATFWVGQARDEVTDEVDQVFVEQAGDVLLGYARLPGVEKRAEAVDMLLRKLQEREARSGSSGTQTPVTQPDRAGSDRAPSGRDEADRAERQRVDKRERQPQRAKRDADRVQATRKRKPEPAAARAPAPEAVEPDPESMVLPVSTVKGVGARTEERLNTLGVHTVGDLLYLLPRRYDDYTKMKPIHRLTPGEQVTIIATIWQVRARRGRNNLQIVQAVVNDGSGSLTVTWYNQPWLARKLTPGTQVALSGKVDLFLGRPVLNSPEWEPVAEEMLKTGRIVPIYPLTEGLSSYKMRTIMQETVRRWAPRVPDFLPEELLRRQRLVPLPQALSQAHFPDSEEFLHRARHRLMFDELLLLQLGMLNLRREWQATPAIPVPATAPLLAGFIEGLPYQLTGAQQRTLDEITGDMARNQAMTRLLQGDVGSGKTVVAAAAMVLAVAAGGQAALMAPTEILAEQHYSGLRELLEPLGVTVYLLTGSVPAGEKQSIYDALASGGAQVVIGTHALIQEAVTFKNLLLAVIDEQHRFGVEQRRALRDQNAMRADGLTPTPHLLAMSATPIPRTLALSIYGDLDLSLLDEMPPGRQEIDTHWIRPHERERGYAFVRTQVAQGRQAYIICPLVEESDKIEAKAAVEEHTRLQIEVFPNLKLGLLHGRMRADEKDDVMRRFKQGELNILVSTSVIEVGVDVPNSTVMFIEGANRFGLAQLHQFRGRVGRGEHKSACLLVADSSSADAEARLRALEETNDGFLLAEKDLELRGPGEFFGKRQSGVPELRYASLLDVRLVELARAEAEQLMAADPDLEQTEHAMLRERVAAFWAAANENS